MYERRAKKIIRIPEVGKIGIIISEAKNHQPSESQSYSLNRLARMVSEVGEIPFASYNNSGLMAAFVFGPNARQILAMQFKKENMSHQDVFYLLDIASQIQVVQNLRQVGDYWKNPTAHMKVREAVLDAAMASLNPKMLKGLMDNSTYLGRAQKAVVMRLHAALAP